MRSHREWGGVTVTRGSEVTQGVGRSHSDERSHREWGGVTVTRGSEVTQGVGRSHSDERE